MIFDQSIDINEYASIDISVDWDLTTEDDDILTSDDIPSSEITLDRDTIMELAELATDDDGDFSWEDFDERVCDWLSETYGWCVNYHEVTDYELID